MSIVKGSLDGVYTIGVALTSDEALVLASLCAKVGGSVLHSARVVTDKLLEQLEAAGVDWRHYSSSGDGSGVGKSWSYHLFNKNFSCVVNDNTWPLVKPNKLVDYKIDGVF